MSLTNWAHAASRGVSRQVFTVKKHSPVLLLGVGIVGFAATTVMACRATLKMHDLLDEAEQLVEHVEHDTPAEAKDVAEKAKFSVKLQTAIKIAKLYAPSVAVGSVTLLAITGSHVILKKRNVSLAAAYTTLDGMYRRYRKNVIADVGDEKDREYRFGVSEKEIVDPESGLVETGRGIDAEEVRKNEFSDYARMFDKWNEHWEPDYRQNIFYLQSVINHFENVLRLRGYVFLNEVYKFMGYKPTKAGQSVGWMRDAHEKGEGDGYISFGLEKDSENAVKFMNGTINDVIVDFNVDGVITHRFDEI